MLVLLREFFLDHNHHSTNHQSINKLLQTTNSTPKSITMKFTQVAILAAASFVAAQETTTEGGLVSSITAAPSKTTHKPSLTCTFQVLTTTQAPPSAV